MVPKTVVIALVLSASPLVHAGGLPDFLFQSNFEIDDQCATFDGLGDTLIIPSIEISGSFTLNGQPFPAIEFDDANISLRDRLTGAELVLGNTHDGSYTANIVPGHYDVIYSVETLGPVAPHNVNGVAVANVALLNSQTFDIDVTAHTLSGDFLLNGAAFPAVEYDDGEIWFDSAQSGRVMIGETKDQSFSDVVVLAGKYDVRYKLQTPGDSVPLNEWGLVTRTTVAADADDLAFNVKTVTLSGDFSLNGGPFPAIEFDDGNLYLERDDGDRALLGNSHDGSYSVNVMTGTYDAFWELETLGDSVPFNERARIAQDVSTSGGTLDLNVQSVALSGAFTLNGGPFPVSMNQSAAIVLRDKVADVDNVLGQTLNSSYDKNIVAGTYNLVYRHQVGTQVPQNKDALLESGVTVEQAGTLDVDVVSRLFTAGLSHNGAAFPAAPDSALIWLVNRSTGDEAIVGSTTSENLEALMVVGTYDAYYSYVQGDDIPQNERALVAEDIVIEPLGPILKGGGLQIDVPSVVTQGQFLVNDSPPPAIEFDDGTVSLRLAEDEVQLGNTHDGTWQTRMVDYPGEPRYSARYSVETLGPVMPINTDARIGCAVLDPAKF